MLYQGVGDEEPLWEMGEGATELLKQLGVELNTSIHTVMSVWFSFLL